MDDRIHRLKTPEECERFAKNAAARNRSDLAMEAQRRAIELRAAAQNAATQAEREALQAIYAYEEVLQRKNGRRTRASRTWQMIDRHGILGAVERAVNRDSTSTGYTALVEMGLQDLAFEAVVLRHPEAFSEETIARARERLQGWANT